MDASAYMEAGHRANKRDDYFEARRNFRAAFELEGKAVAQISAANMALKLGNVEEAMQEYTVVLQRTDLADNHRTLVENKLSGQVMAAVALAKKAEDERLAQEAATERAAAERAAEARAKEAADAKAAKEARLKAEEEAR